MNEDEEQQREPRLIDEQPFLAFETNNAWSDMSDEKLDQLREKLIRMHNKLDPASKNLRVEIRKTLEKLEKYLEFRQRQKQYHANSKR